MAEVELWLNQDVFNLGVVYAHVKLSVTYLRKVVIYAKSKGIDGGYPDLSWNIWKHMAVNKMLMEEDLAWAYFEMFYNLMDLSSKQRIELAELQHQYAESDSPALYKQDMRVPTLQFVLFLFIQQTNKSSLRRSLLGDEWPGASPRSFEGSKGDSSSNILNEQKHVQFVLSHLLQMLEILSEINKDSDTTLHCDVVKALGFIIKGRILGQNNILSLYDIAVRHRVQVKSGYQKTEGCFAVRIFEAWVRSSLSDNPYGVMSCSINGSSLKWSKSVSDSRKRARVLTNAYYAPNNSKLIFFTQCSNQTIARQSDILDGSYVKLHRCHDTHFYLLSPLRCVTIEKCTGSTFVLGPVAVAVRIVGCTNITLIAPCRFIVVSASSEVVLYVTTPTQPIISSDNNTLSSQPITLAPYNTFYPELESHLASIGLTVSPQTDQWNNPVCVGNSGNISLSQSRLSNSFKGAGDMTDMQALFKIMKPSDFYLFTIPFKPNTSSIDCSTSEIPGGLPAEYAQAVKGKQRATERWKRAVKESSMTKDERKQFQSLVEEQFKKWVVESGNQRQLDDLGKKSI
uniref:TBCC domain-containing protein 1 n=1 Tax=Phallusia mammillata TaxID=59560 RepID=A0A6F9DUZ1_9ASCI|nr:TBCC domain-containing protein 1-like [Phallusia mammillata]